MLTVGRVAFQALGGFDKTDAAIRLGRALLRLAPGDPVIGFHLDALMDEPRERAPDQYLTACFDKYAEQFDKHLVEVLGYHVPEDMHALLLRARRNFSRILDLGCGTGLAARNLASFRGTLTGVDISPGMLEKARQRSCYDRLVESEAVDYLAHCDESFDLIVALDVTGYFGDLSQFLAGAAARLSPGGVLAFSLTEDCASYRLRHCGRFAHAPPTSKPWRGKISRWRPALQRRCAGRPTSPSRASSCCCAARNRPFARRADERTSRKQRFVRLASCKDAMRKEDHAIVLLCLARIGDPLDQRMTVIAQNIANAGTAGYRASGLNFEAVLSKAGTTPTAFPPPAATSSPAPTARWRRPAIRSTLRCPAKVGCRSRRPPGVAYTRDGRMQMSETGDLQTILGFPVLDAGGSPIVLDPGGGPPTIFGDGAINQGGRQFGALGLFEIDADSVLTRAENSSVIPSKPATPVLDFARNGVAQGSLESANVNPILEMTKLIMTSRAFDDVNAVNDMMNSSQRNAVRTIGGAS